MFRAFSIKITFKRLFDLLVDQMDLHLECFLMFELGFAVNGWFYGAFAFSDWKIILIWELLVKLNKFLNFGV